MSEDIYYAEEKAKDDSLNNGGSTDYYKLPEGAKDLQDLIEYKNMNFALGNIFKACYRMGSEHHSEATRDYNKMIYFAERIIKEAKRLKHDSRKA